MEPGQEKRLARIIARRARAAQPAEADGDYARRRARERMLAELPRLVARIGDVVAEINDALADSGLVLRLAASEQSPTAEAVFKVRVSRASEGDAALWLNVDPGGSVTALLERDHHRLVLASSTVFDLDKPHVGELMLTLLESAVPEP